MPNQVVELLRKYTVLAYEYYHLAHELEGRYEDIYGKLNIEIEREMTIDTWVTCPTVLAQFHIGCMPGVRLHMDYLWTYRGSVNTIILDFDMAQAPGFSSVEIDYEADISDLPGIIALYQVGLGWVVEKLLGKAHARVLEFTSRVVRTAPGRYEPGISIDPLITIVPEGVGVVSNRLVEGQWGSMEVFDGDWHSIDYGDLKSGVTNGLEGYVVPFIEWAYDTLSRAYNTLAGIGQVLGLITRIPSRPPGITRGFE